MIYGWNFNNTPIPTEVCARLALRLNGKHRRVSADERAALLLAGVCNTDEELNLMTLQADNGHRDIYVTEHRMVRATGQRWYGIYCG